MGPRDATKEASHSVRATSIDLGREGIASSSTSPVEHGTPKTIEHGSPEVVDYTDPTNDPKAKKTWSQRFAFFKTRDFWTILILGQILALCITGTNTFSSLLADEGTNIPAFQTFFNYVLLNLIYTSYTIYKYGFKGYCKFLYKDWWKYIILSFCDVEGNYFTVLAYRYTSILSAQLINFWAIVIVVAISFTLLKVRYHWAQMLGIFLCIGGLGILLASDHITGADGPGVSGHDQLVGDLWALGGATFYGFSNVYEEWFVSGRPLYEVIGQLGFWGMIINGVQAGIFDRGSFRTAVWNGKVGGWLTGYTLLLTIFYSLTPILYRMASAAFFNVSLLTGNFWGVIVGIHVFHLHVHWMYPIAFTVIMIGHFVYYFGKGVLGEAKKSWLGEDQEAGIDGIFTARRRIEQGRMRGLERGEVGVEGPAIV